MNQRYALATGAAVVVLALAGVLVLDPSGLVGADSPADATETPGLVYEGEQLTLQAEADQVVEGRTDLGEGENVSVRLRSTGENPFLKTRTATVDDDGAFEATFDLSDVEGDADVGVVVRHDDTRLVEAAGAVVG